jgi:antitoxin (DNA-binding transcriptional repressor) of toxin-antitoxin stability system
MRELRDTRRLKSLLRAGNTVELKDRNQVIARIVPEKQEERPVKYPDFAARRKKIFGDRVLSIVDDFIKDRGRY